MPPKDTQGQGPKSTEDLMAQFLAQMKDMGKQLEQMSLHNSSMAAELQALKAQVSSSPSNHSSSSTSHSSPHNPIPFGPKAAKVTLSSFDGSNPLDWIFQGDQYFKLTQTPPTQRMALVPFFMSGATLSWFKWLSASDQLSTWDHFIKQLELRFGPPAFENHEAALYKLHQTDTVMMHQQQFEQLSNRVVGLSASSLLNCFLSGLRDDIHHDLAILRPTTLSDAISLAELVDAKIEATKTLAKTLKPSPFSPATNTKPSLLGPTPKNPSLPIKRLTPAEMQARRDKGLCFNCDEKFHPGHRCQKKQFLLLLSEDPPEPPPITPSVTLAIAEVPSGTED